MGIKRVMDSDFWIDPKVDDFSPEDKYFMCYLLTGPYTRQLGIFKISIKYAAIHLGYTEDVVKVLLDRFEHKYDLIIFSKSTQEVAVKGYLRHSIMKGGKPVEDCIKRDIQNVKNKSLISKVFVHLSQYDDLNATVKKVIKDFENENLPDYENLPYYDNDNDNDNDNDVSYHDTCNDTQKPPAKRKKPVKHKYGEYDNVLLTDEELQKLKTEYSDYDERIERLSSYVASTGRKYKSHYATIRNWARKDAETRPINRPYAKQTKADELNDAYAMMADWAGE